MRLFLTVSLVAAISMCAQAGDWPQFLGPARNGISPEKGLATSWPEGGPKELWKFDLNSGFGGSAVKDGKVYVPDRTRGEKDVIYCLDLASGKKLWSLEFDARGRVDYPGPRATPAVDDKYVFFMGQMGDFYCVDLKTHKLAWRMNVLKDGQARLAMWGMACSPVLYKDTVIVAPQGKVGVMAVNKKTGQAVWKSPYIGSMGYASPLIITIDEVEQVAMIATKGVVGLNVKSGKPLWEFTDWRSDIPIASVTDVGEGRLFVTSIANRPYSSDCAMFRVSHKGGQWTTERIFKNLECQSQMHNALLYDNYLYSNSAANGRSLVCLDLEGNVKWSQRGLTDNGGNLVIADGMIYLMDGSNGILRLIKASPDGYKELAQAQVLGRNQVWAPMSIADGKLLCRDQRQLKCLDISGK